MSYHAEGVEMDTPKNGRPGTFTHRANADRLKKQFGYLDETTRCRILNIIEANSRHWHSEAGGNNARFELLFNNEKHEP